MTRLLTKLALTAILAASAGSVAIPAAARSTINVTASNWKFSPAKITLRAGVTTQLRLTSAEGVHGIKSDDLAIPLTTIAPGKATTLSVTPKKAGTYVLHCEIMCGTGHANMALTIIAAKSK